MPSSENLRFSKVMEKDITQKSENVKPTEVAISVNNVSKTFRILASPNRIGAKRAGGPHEKISSLRGAFVKLFRADTFEVRSI